MDFFALQDQARRRTIRLLVLYLLALVVVVLLFFLAAVLLVEGFRLILPQPELPRVRAWQDLNLFGWMATYVFLIVGGGALYRWIDLRSGGKALAGLFCARRVNTWSPGMNERQLINVVEEMAIAAGIPVPEVYILDRHGSINAMAAGYSIDDAAIILTRGAVQHLNRDELQGVVAHEFSHILNGDMRLNLRLVSLLNGLVAIYLAGETLLHLVFDRDEAVGITLARGFASAFLGVAVLFLGFSMKAIGYVGAIAARLIQAAVTRQREFLADAAAVQFTRNPLGIGGALIKIGGHVQRGAVRNAYAGEASHMFMVEAVHYTHNLFDSHPPLRDRIRRTVPSFDGKFPVLKDLGRTVSKAPALEKEAIKRSPSNWSDRGIPELIAAAQIGVVALEANQLERAQRILSGMPAPLREAAHDVAAAQALLFFLLAWDQPVAFRAMEEADPDVRDAFDRILPALRDLSSEAFLPLAEMLLPTLHQLSLEQYEALRHLIEEAVDWEELSLSGFCLRQVALHHLDRHFGIKPRRPRPAIHSLKKIRDKVFVVLGALAHAGPKDADKAIQAAKTALPIELHSYPLPKAEECNSKELAAALALLPSISLKLKRSLMEAAVLCVSSDQRLAVQEAELLHMLAAALGLPAPSVLGLTLPSGVEAEEEVQVGD